MCVLMLLIRSREAVVTPQVVEAVLAVSASADARVIQMSLMVLGQLGGWFSKHRPYLGNGVHETACYVY